MIMNECDTAAHTSCDAWCSTPPGSANAVVDIKWAWEQFGAGYDQQVSDLRSD